jgi:GMP synthase (glutamine-hydrolysing)
MQAMAAQLGGEVESSSHREFGHARVHTAAASRLLDGLAKPASSGGPGLDVWMSHGDRVRRLPPGFQAIASSANAPLAGMADESRRYYALQFHPEVTHTDQGQRIIERFVHTICGCPDTWRPGNIIARDIARVRAQVGRDRVLLGLSGGVDSSVVAALLQRALGEQLICVFVDTGLLREREGDEVMETFAAHLGVSASTPASASTPRSPVSAIPSRNARSSGGCSWKSSKRRPGSSLTSAGWRRARSIPT